MVVSFLYVSLLENESQRDDINLKGRLAEMFTLIITDCGPGYDADTIHYGDRYNIVG